MANGHSFLDCEIHIAARRDEHYPVHIRLGDEQDFNGGLAADLIPWTPAGNPTTDGQRLFTALFTDPQLRRVWDIACGKSSHRRIRLWIDTDVPELHALPWELLHDGPTFLAANATTPFSRYLPSDAPWGGLVTERPIRILAVIANPADLAQPPYNLTPLDVTAECALLTDALGNLAPTHLRIEYLEAPVTLECLERALASGPHVLHFVGHGTFNDRKQQAALYLQDAAGDTQPVTDVQLCNMLRGQAKLPTLIFLAACQSAERSEMDAFAGLAPKLVQTGIPAVVAMQDQVAIAATHTLTPVFYEELARHGEVDRALNAARSLLLTGQSPDAATPVLLMRLKEGQLWEPLWAKTNPYRGLAAFTEDDAKFFFGRDQLIATLLAHLRSDSRFLVVVGASGSGKSSVVQAGLVPALRKGALFGSQDWPIVTFRPGNDPYANSVWQKAQGEWRTASGEWRGDIGRFVLIVDQFEELFALCAATVQKQFLDDLLALIDSPAPATVILTVRADFYEYLLHHTLSERIQQAQVNVLPMKAEELRAAIEEPARQVGLQFEAGLVETILQDASASAHALPLLQSALTQLWHKQAQGVLTYTAYRAIGGVTGAISLWADDAYSRLSAPEKLLARRVLTRLVHYGEAGAADTRQRQAQADLVTEPGEQDTLRRVVRKLADARLVVTGEGETIEIIHDALLREWGQLKQWIAEQREFYLWRQRLNVQLQTWKAQQEDEGALLRGALLVEAERWLQEKADELNDVEEAYIHKGIALREDELAAQKRLRQRITFGISAVVALIVLMLAGFGWFQRDRAIKEAALRQEADEKARIALARQVAAQSQQIIEGQPSLLPRAVLLATESLSRSVTLEGDQALANGLALLPRRLARMNQTSIVAFSSNGRWMVTVGSEHQACVWDTTKGQEPICFSHDGPVNAVAFSPDAQWLATAECNEMDSSADYDKQCLHATVHLWAIAHSRELAHLPHESGVNAVTFSPDGERIATASMDNTARLWDVSVDLKTGAVSGRELARFQHDGPVWSVAFSPDHVLLVTASNDRTARLWDISIDHNTGAVSGRELARMEHPERVYSAVFGPNGLWVATTCRDDIARVWNIWFDFEAGEAGAYQDTSSMYNNVSLIAFSPDGQWVATVDEYTVHVWDTFSYRESARLTLDVPVLSIAFSPDGQWIATASRDNAVRVWRVADSREIARMTHDYWLVTTLVFSPNGQRLVTISDNTAYVWEIARGRDLVQMPHDNWVNSVAFSPDGQWAATASDDYTARVWEVSSGREITQLQHNDAVYDVLYSPDNQWLATRSSNADYLWEAASDYAISYMLPMSYTRDMAFSPDSRWIAATGEGIARVWEVASGRDIASLPHSNWVVSVAFSPDSRWVATTTCDKYDNNNWCIRGAARVWDVAGEQELIQLWHDDMVNKVIFSPDGQHLVTVSDDDTARIWEVVVDPDTGAFSGRELTRLPHDGDVDNAIFSLNGRRLATEIRDAHSNAYAAHVWDISVDSKTGTVITRELASLAHDGVVFDIAFSPDGQWLATGSYRVVRIWEAANGREVARLPHQESVITVVFSPDGKWIATANVEGRYLRVPNQDNAARLWLWQTQDLIDLACSRLTRNLTHAEWTQYLGDEPYRATCPNLPIPEE